MLIFLEILKLIGYCASGVEDIVFSRHKDTLFSISKCYVFQNTNFIGTAKKKDETFPWVVFLVPGGYNLN